MQENFKHKKPQQMGIIENAEDGEGKRSASMSEQQRKLPPCLERELSVCMRERERERERVRVCVRERVRVCVSVRERY